jgi:preprotein translocase subunit SecB
MMDESINSIFKFDRYIVDYIEFSQNNDFIPDEDNLEVVFSIDVEIGIQEDLLGGKVSLVVNIFEGAVKLNYPFSSRVSLTGYFSVVDIIERAQLTNLLEINGTAVLFPFVRSTVADITRISNISPVIIPLINIHNMMKKKEEESN